MMKKHRNKFLIGILVVAVLAGLWFMSGMDNRGAEGPAQQYSSAETTPQTGLAGDTDTSAETEGSLASSGELPDPTTDAPTTPEPAIGESDTDALDSTDSTGDPTTEPAASSTEEPTEPPTATPAPTSTTAPETAAPTQDINPDTGKDRYLTDPVPNGRPLPVEPQDMVVGDGSFTVTLSVRCDTLLDNMHRLDKEKHELVPEDGVIFAAQTVTVYEGESVFNVLQREMRRAKIHMEFVNTPIYNSAYIEGINNLYEFDGGELSGWMYKVNDWFPNYGCSRYLLQPGDVIEWVYTCDLGRDVGGFYATGG